MPPTFDKFAGIVRAFVPTAKIKLNLPFHRSPFHHVPSPIPISPLPFRKQRRQLQIELEYSERGCEVKTFARHRRADM
jgi:hypothetical protein